MDIRLKYYRYTVEICGYWILMDINFQSSRDCGLLYREAYISCISRSIFQFYFQTIIKILSGYIISNYFVKHISTLHLYNNQDSNSLMAIQAIRPAPISMASSSMSKVGVWTPETIPLASFLVPNL